MKLLLIHNYYRKQNIGGEDIVFDAELAALQDRLGADNVLVYTVESDAVHMLRMPLSIWFSFKHYNAVTELIHRHHIDIVHVHNFFPVLTPSVFVAAKRAGARVIHTVHNYRVWCISGILYNKTDGVHEFCARKKFSFRCVLHRSYHDSYLQSIFIGVVFFWYKLMKFFAAIDYFVALTIFEKEKIISFGIPREQVVLKPNFVNISPSTSIQKKGYYVFVGRLEQAKGIEELLLAWKDMEWSVPIKIIGSGPLEEQLKMHYASYLHIEFLGRRSRKETIEYIRNAKYLIHPSICYETFGLTILEALSCGTPVIGRNLGTRLEFIEDGVNGFLYDTDTFLSVLKKSWSYAQYDDLVEGAYTHALRYSKQKVIQDQLEMYNTII